MTRVEQVLIGRRLIMPLTVVFLTIQCGAANAQGAFPAPLPGRTTVATNDPAFPPVNGAAPVASLGAPSASFPVSGTAPVSSAFSPAQPQASGPDACMQGFLPLRQEAEKRGKLIKAASDRHAPPAEACKLIGNFAAVETKMMKYVEVHMAKCGIPPQILDQLKNGHKGTETMQQKVCAAAEQMAKGPAGPSLSDVLGSATALPEASTSKKGGGTFDTLSGNALTR